ncbi:MAG: hypothetical protein V4568_00710 [Pseudomonadota bacterium]
MNKMPPPEILNSDKQATIPSLVLKDVQRLLIYHLSDSTTTPIAVSPNDLNDFDHVERFETTNPKDFHAAYDALCAGKPSLDFHIGINARWGTVFINGSGESLLTAYTDHFGVQGVVNNVTVWFSRPTFYQWLERTFKA